MKKSSRKELDLKKHVLLRNTLKKYGLFGFPKCDDDDSSTNGLSREKPSADKRSDTEAIRKRIELKTAFEELRALVPELAAKRRPSKLAILESSASYCKYLYEENVRKIVELEKEQEKLRARLQELQNLKR